jgi:hypothetical protein
VGGGGGGLGEEGWEGGGGGECGWGGRGYSPPAGCVGDVSSRLQRWSRWWKCRKWYLGLESEPRVSAVIALSIRMANFGWAHPNRVVSQAVFQKIAIGHPKFGAEREVRAPPWGFALIASRLDAPRVQNKTVKKNLP